MKISELQKIAERHGLGLQPISGMESHLLFGWLGEKQSAKKHYRNLQLDEITAEQFEADCLRASAPAVSEPIETNPVELYLRRRASYSPITGHFRGGSRGEGRRGR